MNDQSNEPIPIPTPQNLTSQFTTEMMETLIRNDFAASSKTAQVDAVDKTASSLQQVKVKNDCRFTPKLCF